MKETAERGYGLSMSRAVTAALIVEGLLIAAITAWIGTVSVPPAAAVQAPIKIALVTLPKPPASVVAPPKPKPPKPKPPKPAPPKPPPPKPPPPKKVEPPKPAPKPKPPPPKRRVRKVVHRVVRPLPPPEPPPPKPAPPLPAPPKPVSVRPTPAPPRVVSAAPTVHQLAAFEATLRAAIQRALVYPAAARMMHLRGQVRVAFDYHDGKVTNVRVIEAAGFPAFNRAAAEAVARAAYPMPIPAIGHRLMHFVLWVRFEPTTDY